MSVRFSGTYMLPALFLAFSVLTAGSALAGDCECTEENTIKADVVALDQAYFNNRRGAFQAGGMVFALKRDVQSNDGSNNLVPGKVMLRPNKRPRPMVLRMNQGQCLEITFTNLLNLTPQVSTVIPPTKASDPYNPNLPANNKWNQDDTNIERTQSATRYAGFHAQGMNVCETIKSDGSWVGRNESSLVAPGDTITYTLYSDAVGTFLAYSTGANVGNNLGFGGQLMDGLFGAINVQPKGSEWYRSQVTREDMDLATIGTAPTGQPLLNYDATYPSTHERHGEPILKMLQGNQIAHTDLTAIITGPKAGNFPASYGDPKSPDFNPVFADSPAYPNRLEPWREITTIYHDDFVAKQAFPQFDINSEGLNWTLQAGRDFFAINYGMGGIGAEILSNRLKVGPEWDCVGCKFEEFFLSSWPLGDPAMIVDVPANATDAEGQLQTGPKATKAFYPDDPSNVYHSYIGDGVKFQVLHGGTNISHVHHQHAHQWLHSPNSDDSNYRDSQMITPGAAYTMDYVYRGSGNKNQVVGDSIFHCHFYPHFAQGMWALWRTHDTFEQGTQMDPDGKPVVGWNRALPDGEISTGVATPAVVPIPSIAMAPMPARTRVVKAMSPANASEQVGYKVEVNPNDLAKGMNPGFPFYIPGVAGQRAPHPPLDFAKDTNGNELDGGLPRHLEVSSKDANGKSDNYMQVNRWDFTKEDHIITAQQLPEEGTDIEKVAMKAHATRKHASSTQQGQKEDFILNGRPPVAGAPYADPLVNLEGKNEFNGKPIEIRHYKGANIQLDVVLNKKGWHYPQQRIISLYEDINDYLDNKRRPEPFFFRANSGEGVVYQHTNLVPSYFKLDDNEVRTPTDIIGQHIHLVKFDVTSSDGAANGFNYEDGTFSSEEVRNLIGAINKAGGLWNPSGSSQSNLTAKPIPDLGSGPNGDWVGAQATIQRWYADPLLNNKGEDRTIRSVFTHDHYGPSTHQQVGLYSALLIEPTDSKWTLFDGTPMGTRADGGPTSWTALIETPDSKDSYREFAIEFQDRQFAYTSLSRFEPVPYQEYTNEGSPFTIADNQKPFGWSDFNNAINPPQRTGSQNPHPHVVTNQFKTGSYSLNYQQEPLYYRLAQPTGGTSKPNAMDLSHVFRSIERNDPLLNSQHDTSEHINPTLSGSDPGFMYPPPQDGALPTDPFTPLLRAYAGDKIQIRSLVGAHMSPHFYKVHGINWQFEPAWKESGLRGAQGMGISEYYEFLFDMPPNTGNTADYLYATSSGATGLTNGNWGIMRAYSEDQDGLKRLSNNPANPKPRSIFDPNAETRTFKVTATTAKQAYGAPLVYNNRGIGFPGENLIVDWNALVYVHTDDLDANGKLKPGVPHEPLVLRAKAGENIKVELTNALPADLDITSGPSTTYQDSFFLEGTKTEVDKWLLNLQTNNAYSSGFRAAFNKNPYGYKIPADPNDTYMTPIPILEVPPFNPPTLWTIQCKQQNADCSGPTFTTYQVNDTTFVVNAGISVKTSTEVGLHPQMVTYDVTKSDGVNVGINPVQTVKPGQSTTYEWYAGNIEKDGTGYKHIPVEFGSINLTPSDPLMQHPLGLIGALIIEPPESEWKEDPNSRLSATVNYVDAKGEKATYREFVAVLQDDVSSLAFGTTGELFVRAQDNAWNLNGNALANNSTIQVAPGQVITAYLMNGDHGFSFMDKAAAQAAFNIEQQRLPLKDQPSVGPKAYGTDGSTNSGIVFVRLTLKAGVAKGTKIAFQDTVTKTAMAGTFEVVDSVNESTTAVANNFTRALNYRTEPFDYRFWNKPGYLSNVIENSPMGVGQALSNSKAIPYGDPQTPVFAAAQHTPVRMRLLHPAGLSDQNFTIHGHNWQELPWTNNSTRLGDNPFSQNMGTRTSFGPNVSFDLLIDGAGGKGGTCGDYLMRTFVGTDFLFGIWGVLRVVPENQDMVAIDDFRIWPYEVGKMQVSGYVTPNLTTGAMAKNVQIFQVTNEGNKKGAMVPVDPITGAYASIETIIGPGLKGVVVQSDQGGSATTSSNITINQEEMARFTPTDKKVVEEMFRFKPRAMRLGPGVPPKLKKK